MSRHSDEIRDGSSTHWAERDLALYPPFDVFKQPGSVQPRLNPDAVSFQSDDDAAFASAQARRAFQLNRCQSVPAMPKEATAAWTPKNRGGGSRTVPPPQPLTDAASTGNASSTLSADDEQRLLDQMSKLSVSNGAAAGAGAGAGTPKPGSSSAGGSPLQPRSASRSPSSVRSARRQRSAEGSQASNSGEDGYPGAASDAATNSASSAAAVAASIAASIAAAASTSGAAVSSAPIASAQMAAAATAPEFAMGGSSAPTTMGSTAGSQMMGNMPQPHPHAHHQPVMHAPHHMHAGNPYQQQQPPPMGGMPHHHLPADGLGHHPHDAFVAPPAVPAPAFYMPPQDMMQRPGQPMHMQQWQQQMQYPPPMTRPATVGPTPQAQICKYFAQGSCAKGDQCGYLHVFATKATAMVGAKPPQNGAPATAPYHPQQPSVGAFDNGDGASTTAYSDHSSVHPHSLRANGLGAGSTTGSRRGGGGGSTVDGDTSLPPRAGGGIPGSHSPPLNRGRYAGTQQSVGAYSNTRAPHSSRPPPSPITRSYSSLGHMTGGNRPNGGFDDYAFGGRGGGGGGGNDIGAHGSLHRHQSSYLSGEMPGAGTGANQDGGDYGFLTPRANPHPYMNGDQPMTARDIATQVYMLAKDQHGCRLLQRMLEDRDKLTFEVIFTEVFRHINELMTDPFGNYLIQKLMDFATDEQRLKILHKVAHDLVAISLNIHGTRVVQKMLEVMTTDAEKQLVVRATRSSVVTLTKDLNGNHVIQRCLQHMEADYNQFIYDAISIHCVSVATHKHGCCVLQRCIDFAVERQRIQLISVIVSNALELVQDAFGNYVVQYVIDNAGRQVSRALMKQLLGSISNLAVQKFSSNVIEKCLQNADDDIKVCIIDELIDPQRLPRLLQDPYANYVIQKALSVTKQERFNYLIELIRPHVRALRATSFGKRIQSKIIKRFPILAMDDPPMGPADHPRVGVY